MRKLFIIFPLLFISIYLFPQDRFRSGIFLHHSTGRNIWGPNGSSTSVPDEIARYNADHGYSGDEQCSMNEKWFPSNHGNEWADWHHLFDKDYTDDDVWQYISSNKIVVIKSCFPSSAMTGWGEASDTVAFTTKSVYNYKWHWRHIIRIMEAHPENFFVIWTNAPLVVGATNDDQAWWSHAFCTWAKDTLAEGKDPVYGTFPKNVYVFDYFHKLVGGDFKEKPEYANSNTDSHPNAAATELVAPQFVQEIFDAAIVYEGYFNGALAAPTLVSPPDNATDVSLNSCIVWNKVDSVSGYMLEISETSDFSTTIVSVSVSDTCYDLSGNLESNTKYYWRVKSLKDGNESVWSTVWSFTIVSETGIKDRSKSMEFKIFPNPSTGEFYINLNNQNDLNQIYLYDSMGRYLETIIVKNKPSIRVNLRYLLPGVYYLKPVLNGSSMFFRVVITK